MTLNNSNWDESKHPRDDKGKFTYASGSGSSKSSEDRLRKEREEKARMQRAADILYPTMKDNKNGENLSSENVRLKGGISYNAEGDKYGTKFSGAMDIVFKNEGGFSDDSNDCGGRTNMGITQKTYDNYCKKNGLKTKDVKLLTKSEVKEIYYNDYWKASGADKIEDPALATVLFDTAVLHGVGRAKQFYAESNGNYKKILELRNKQYEKIVEKNVSQRKYLKGWQNRTRRLLDMFDK